MMSNAEPGECSVTIKIEALTICCMPCATEAITLDSRPATDDRDKLWFVTPESASILSKFFDEAR